MIAPNAVGFQGLHPAPLHRAFNGASPPEARSPDALLLPHGPRRLGEAAFPGLRELVADACRAMGDELISKAAWIYGSGHSLSFIFPAGHTNSHFLQYFIVGSLPSLFLELSAISFSILTLQSSLLYVPSLPGKQPENSIDLNISAFSSIACSGQTLLQ